MKIRLEKTGAQTVINVIGGCPGGDGGCECSTDTNFYLHNWILFHDFRYLIVCFDDERKVCAATVASLTQTVRRLSISAHFVIEWDSLREAIKRENAGSQIRLAESWEEPLGLNSDLQRGSDILARSDTPYNETIDTALAKKPYGFSRQPQQPANAP